MADPYGSHWSDALKYIADGGKFDATVPPSLPLTATHVRLQQEMLERHMKEQAEKLGVTMDKDVIDAMQGMLAQSGVTNVMKGTSMTVGDNSFFSKNNLSPYSLLAARLRIDSKQGVEGHYWFDPLDYVNIVFDDTKAFITVIAHGKASVLEDDAKNFPTDELVAQFRILLASQ